MKNIRARLLLGSLFAASFFHAGAGLAQQPVRYKLAETAAPGGPWRYEVIDRRAPAAPAGGGTVDLQLMSLDRLADDPYVWLRNGLNAKLEADSEDKPLLLKHFAPKPIELKLFEIHLIREYPKSTKYTSAAGSGAGGLLGVLIGAVMDGMSNRANVALVVRIRVVLDIDGKPVETSSEQVYAEEVLQDMLFMGADEALKSLVLQLRAQAHELEKAGAETGARTSRVEEAAPAAPAPAPEPPPAPAAASAAAGK